MLKWCHNLQKSLKFTEIELISCANILNLETETAVAVSEAVKIHVSLDSHVTRHLIGKLSLFLHHPTQVN